MPTRVQLPDGSIGEFPDGMSQSDIEGVLQKQYGGPQSSRPDDPRQGGISSFADASGISSVGHAIMHPIDTISSIPSGLQSAWANTRDNVKEGIRRGDAGNISGMEESFTRAVPLLGPAIGKTADQADAGNYSGAVGTSLGTLFAPEIAELTGRTAAAVPKAIAQGVTPIGQLGEGMQDLAAANLNRKYPPTMREMERGNNPGRGILDSGIGPTISRGSLANKVSGATEAVGSRIGDAVNRADNNVFAPTINSGDLRAPIRGPIQEQLGVVNGPGGTTPETPYTTLHDSMQLRAPGAKNPIYGPNAPDTVLPSDLWATIKNVDKNTRFNVDPEVENVNETRRDIRSNLRPILESTDPTLRPLSRTYGDLRAADTAIGRSQAPFNIPRGLSSILDSTINSVPVTTTVSSALNRIGGGLKNMATNAPRFLGGEGGAPSALPFAYRMQKPPLGLPNDVPGNSDYGPRSMEAGGFPGRGFVVPPSPLIPMALTAESRAGDIQPMIGLKAPSHPGVAEDFSRTRIAPSRAQLNRMGGTILPSETEGLQLGNGPVMRALPEVAGGGDVEPMVGIRKIAYPPLADPFAKMRVRPNSFAEPIEIRNSPFEAAPSGNVYGDTPRGPRGLPAPAAKTKKGKV